MPPGQRLVVLGVVHEPGHVTPTLLSAIGQRQSVGRQRRCVHVLSVGLVAGFARFRLQTGQRRLQ